MAKKANNEILKNFFKNQVWLKKHHITDNQEELKTIKEKSQIFSFCNIFEITKYDIFNDMRFEEIENIIDNNDEIKAQEVLNNFNISTIILPSPWTYIGFPEYGPVAQVPQYGVDVFFNGALITNEMVIMFVRVVNKKTKNYIHSFNTLYANKTWFPYSKVNSNAIRCLKEYTIITMLLYVIDSFQSTIIDTRSADFKLKCNLIDKKRQIPRPQAYYRVEMKDGTRYLTDQEIDDRLRIVREKTYAYFVKAHNKHRISRGSMPIDEKMERWLRKDPKRKIFTSQDQIDPESLKVLTKRGIFWRDGEWIALLPYRVTAHIANSKDGKNPYIPSIHVVKPK